MNDATTQPPTASDADLLQMLIVRETVRVQADILKSTGWPALPVASEMIVQALMMVVPNVTADQAREVVNGFWKTFLADYSKKLAEVGAAQKRVLPFTRYPFGKPAKNDGGAV